jgi:alpha-galactosidase
VEIPIIAANLHRLILPRQSQIWATLRASDSVRRLTYSLVATFLGRMCLSGDLPDLNAAQWKRVESAMAFYTRVSCIIRNGYSRRYGPEIVSMRHPTGWQVMLRMSASGDQGLAVCHTFARPVPAEIAIPLPEGRWKLSAAYGEAKQPFTVCNGVLFWKPAGTFAGGAALLEKSHRTGRNG